MQRVTSQFSEHLSFMKYNVIITKCLTIYISEYLLYKRWYRNFSRYTQLFFKTTLNNCFASLENTRSDNRSIIICSYNFSRHIQYVPTIFCTFDPRSQQTLETFNTSNLIHFYTTCLKYHKNIIYYYIFKYKPIQNR